MRDHNGDSSRPLRILHVEDDAAHAELVRRGFEDNPIPSELRWVQTAKEALATLLDERIRVPDLLLLDLRLPGDDGIEVLRRVRVTPRLGALPVAILTSSQNEPDHLRPLRHWLDGYFVKPLDIDGFTALLGELQQVARRGRSG